MTSLFIHTVMAYRWTFAGIVEWLWLPILTS